MKEKIEAYKKKLEQGIADYMAAPVSERSASAVRGMVECWEVIDKLGHCSGQGENLSQEAAKHWVGHMENSDGTVGAYWTMEQTAVAAETRGVTFEHISPWGWWATMNMMYSDYCEVAARYGVGTTEFYADMAKAFLFDRDAGGPEEKLAEYYRNIAAE